MKTDKPKIWHITNMPSEAGSQFVSKQAYDFAFEQLEQKVKEVEEENRHLQIIAKDAVIAANKSLEAFTICDNKYVESCQKRAAQDKVIEKQAQELDKLYPLITKICTVSNGLSFYVRNEFNEAKLQSDDQSDLAKRLWDLYNIQCDLEQLTKESK